MARYITLSTISTLLRIPPGRLMYIEAEGNYSTIHVQGAPPRRVPFQLGAIAQIIYDQIGEEETPFLRVGRSLIVNKDFIFAIDIPDQSITISDCIGHYHVLQASRKVLTDIKFYLERTDHEQL